MPQEIVLNKVTFPQTILLYLTGSQAVKKKSFSRRNIVKIYVIYFPPMPPPK